MINRVFEMADSDSEKEEYGISDSPMPDVLLDASHDSQTSMHTYGFNVSSESEENSEDFEMDDDKLDSSNEIQVRNRANDLAKSQIKKIENEMKKMHQKHCQLLKDMDNNYAAIEQETHQRYIEFITKWKDHLKQKIEQYRKMIESLNMEIGELKDLNSNSQEIISKAIMEKNLILEKYNKDITEKDLQREKDLNSMQNSYDKQLKSIQKSKLDLQQRVEELLTENEQLKAQIEAENTEKIQMKARLSKYKAYEKDLKSKLKTQTEHYLSDVSKMTMDSIIKKLEENEQVSETVRNMKQDIEKLRKKKTSVKKQITQWVQDFEKINNRKCENVDKEQIKHLYTKYVEKNKKHENLVKKLESLKYECSVKKITVEERNPTPFKLRSRSPSSNLNISNDSVRERKSARDESMGKEKSEPENKKEPRPKLILSSRNSSNTVANNIICSASSLELQQVKAERDQLKAELNKLQRLLRESKKEALGPVIEETQLQVESYKGKVAEMEKNLQNLQGVMESYKHNYENLVSQFTEDLESDTPEVATLKSQLSYLNSQLMAYRDKSLNGEVDIDLEFQKKKLSDENFALSEQLKSLRSQILTQESETQEKIKEIESKCSQTIRQIHEDIQKSRKENIKLQETEKELRSQNEKLKDENFILTENNSKLEQKLENFLKDIQEYRQELKDSTRQRKLLHNQLEDLRGKIRVFCRIRPMSDVEVAKGCMNISTIIDDFSFNIEANPGKLKKYSFDAVFGPQATQEEVFEDTRRLIQSAVDGFNVCIFAYGQTGSGKTYTIQGYQGKPGIVPRGIDELYFIASNLSTSYTCTINCYMVELHMLHLIDLFRPKTKEAPPALTIKTDYKGMVYIPEVYLINCESAAHMKAVYEDGIKNRHTSKTKMNETSSRSHLIFCIMVEVNNIESGDKTVGKICFVDLAGSERLGRSEATPENLKESTAINKSLLALGDVISALTNKVSHIPYRNNKLTMLMSDSIGGTAKTLMFVNISPAHINREETLMSLFYGDKVKLISNEPMKNVESKEMVRLKSELNHISNECEKYKKILVSCGMMDGVDDDEKVDDN